MCIAMRKNIEEMVVNKSSTCPIPNPPKHCTSDTTKTNKRAIRDMLFELLYYGTLSSQNSVVAVGNSCGPRENR